MKVAICYTKRRTDEIMESFTKGVVSSGDHVELVKSKSDLHKLERCDVSFQIAEVTRYESLCYHSDPHGMAEEGYMRVAIKNKIPIRFGCASCRCGTCAVRVSGNGELSPMADNEKELLATMSLSTGGDIRLSCQARALDGTTEVDLDFQDEYDPAG